MPEKKKEHPPSSNTSDNVPRGTRFDGGDAASCAHLGVLIANACQQRLELDNALREIEQYMGHDVDGLDTLIDELAGTTNGGDAEALQMFFAIATRAAAPRASDANLELEGDLLAAVQQERRADRNKRGGQ